MSFLRARKRLLAAATDAEQAQAKLISGVYSGLKIQAIFFYQLRDLSREKLGFQAYADVPQGALPPLP